MKYLIPTLLLLLTKLAVAQDAKRQLEVMPFIRFDSYPEISFNYADRVSTDYLKMKGTSWGTNINYRYLLGRNFRVKAGVGYYRFSFTELNDSTIWGPTKSRPIDINSTLDLLYHTDRYWYNCVSLNVGLEKSIPLSRSIHIFTSVNFGNYFTYSQNYHITHDDSKYKGKQKQHFGYSGNLNFGITKTLKKYSFGAYYLLPVYDSWRKDVVFEENKKESRYKWRDGWGFGVTLNKSLSY